MRKMTFIERAVAQLESFSEPWRQTAPSLSLVLVMAFVSVLPAQAEAANEGEPSTLAEALKTGKVTVQLRYRSEWVDEDNNNDSAWASTLRASLAYKSGEYKGWSLYLEAEDVTAVVDDDEYRNLGAGGLDNGVRGVSVVADPEITEMNQAYFRFKNGRFEGLFGRQEINLGDQRFVGAVAWRQNHQSFDAVRLKFDASDSVKLDYSFLENTNRIFGDNKNMSSHLLNVPVELADAGSTWTLYGYLLDYEEPADSRLSTASYGAELKGSRKVADGPWKWSWEAEVAQQDDAGDNPNNVDAQYLLANLGVASPSFGFDMTWETLSGEPGKGRFTTPLATLHKFNGWADKFLNTPSAGLETLYLRLKGGAGTFRWMVIYHQFTSDFGDFDYGTEWDAELKYTAPWKQVFALKAALYDADEFSVDTEKLMLWSAYKF